LIFAEVVVESKRSGLNLLEMELYFYFVWLD
jgi:hypothetical protein